MTLYENDTGNVHCTDDEITSRMKDPMSIEYYDRWIGGSLERKLWHSAYLLWRDEYEQMLKHDEPWQVTNTLRYYMRILRTDTTNKTWLYGPVFINLPERDPK